MSLKKILNEFVPRLSLHKHKGQDGRLCVIGGSLEYTGAPYFAGIAALKSGADLVTIVCEKSAAIPIKSYSPELVVEPLMRIVNLNNHNHDTVLFPHTHTHTHVVRNVISNKFTEVLDPFDIWLRSPILKRFSSIVCGPGLGRHPELLQYAYKVIQKSMELRKPLILDGDALYLLSLSLCRDMFTVALQCQASNYKYKSEMDGNVTNVNVNTSAIVGQQPNTDTTDTDANANHEMVSHDNTHSALHSQSQSNLILTPNAMEFRRLWINFMLQKEITGYVKHENDYLPPFDTVDLMHALVSNSNANSNAENENENDGQNEQNKKNMPPLNAVLCCKHFTHIQHVRDTSELAQKLGFATILRKGTVDIICDGQHFILVMAPISGRRCGGQGDILAGFCGLWTSWIQQQSVQSRMDIKRKYGLDQDLNLNLLAAFAASYLLRHVAADAFAQYKRSTLTTNMIEFIPAVMEREFPVPVEAAELNLIPKSSL